MEFTSNEDAHVQLHLTRIFAWAIGIAALVLVAMRYDSLPAVLPLTRWSSAPKTWLTALRVPGICLLSIGLVEVLCASVRRAPDFARGSLLTAILLLTAAWKSAAAAISLVLLPARLAWLDALWIGLTYVGVGLALWVGKDLRHGGRLRRLKWTKPEALLFAALGLLLLALQIPLLQASAAPQ
jgi:hypothetical protein